MSRTFILVLAFLALACTASAHGSHRTFKAKRDVSSSQCSSMSCAVANGNCATSGSSLTFCPTGQFCGANNTCTNNIAIGQPCNPNAQENECASGNCVDSGNGAVCQIYQEVMPGNECTQDSQCFFSNNVDGSGPWSSTCDNGVCAGKKVGDTCIASHQCLVGSFCSSGKCQSLGASGASCQDDSQCSSRFTCFNSACSQRYSQSAGQSCSTTANCASGLYCSSSKMCTKAKTSAASGSQCDISSNNCPADEQCSCNGFNGQSATCGNIAGTFSSMSSFEQKAYSCMDSHACGTDFDNSSTISCVANNCKAEYCTYITRASASLFSDFPSCLVARMVGSQDYNTLLNSCNVDQYKPSGDDGSSSTSATSASSALSASLSWIALVSFAIFFFHF